MALLEAAVFESSHHPEQEPTGLSEMKETTVATGRGIIMCLMPMIVICIIQVQTLQAILVLEVCAIL